MEETETEQSPFSPQDLESLREARSLLENPGLAARLSDLLGSSIEKGFAMLPETWAVKIHQAVELSLNKALQMALATLGRRSRRPTLEKLHAAAVVGTGGLGGAFGLAGLPVELPISTAIMLRSIAEIARSEGEDLQQTEARLACLEVFALGGKSQADEAAETGYYAVRAALAGTVSEAARHLAEQGLSSRGAPALVRLVTAISSRFGITVSEKAAAMAIPALGALGGGLVNGIFIDHFQNMARGHFAIRRLERQYGRRPVQAQYQKLGRRRAEADREKESSPQPVLGVRIE